MSETVGTVVQLKDGRTRQFRSKQERRQIVEETLKPGASVSVVARSHNVNTNQVFKWRRQYKQGELEPDGSAAMLPVRISDGIPGPEKSTIRSKSRRKKLGIIDIDLGHARVRIEGAADPECVRAALQGLVR